MKFLISGFEPFLDLKINPTELLVNNLSKEIFSSTPTLSDIKNLDQGLNEFGVDDFKKINFDFKCIVLPVEFINSFLVLKQQIDIYKPDVVLSFGVASERQQIELERIAINHQSMKNSDNTGHKPLSLKICDHGPDGLFTNLKVDEIVERMNQIFEENKSDQKIKVSNSAGTYVCNALMYNLLMDARRNNYLAGFIHVPNKIDDASIQNLKFVLLEIINCILKARA